MRLHFGLKMPSSLTFTEIPSALHLAKKSTPSVVELVEGEHDVINLGKVEGSMAAALQALRHEYTTSVTARITPGRCRWVWW